MTSPLIHIEQNCNETETSQVRDGYTIQAEGLQQLIDALLRRGYEVLGPQVRDAAIVYDHLTSVDDLPCGWTDEQTNGRYRLRRRDDNALFGFVVGPHSWKQFLYPPLQTLWTAERAGHGFHSAPKKLPAEKYALLGVRPCELQAIALHDRIFLQEPYADPSYKARREQLFIVAVNCGEAGGNCFCVSMNTGPRAGSGYDLVLTELSNGGLRYLVEAGSDRGAELLSEISSEPASRQDWESADSVVAATAARMGRALDTHGLKEMLYRQCENPEWDNVAERCLSCGNCTMVCPTCFCTTVEDATDLTGTQAERRRRWDSCFTLDFSYIHGGSVRVSPRSRFRQWMTHKLAAWIDQFGTSGCVGCGRCITWCPVGIDITAEARVLRESEMSTSGDVSRSSHDRTHS